MSDIDISVIVATYDRDESVRETLAALGRQIVREPLRLEIVVADNNSADGTRAVAQEAGARSRWPVRYLFEPRQGKSVALNTALLIARGGFICLTDDDVIPEAGWAQALYDASVTHGAECVGGKILPLWFAGPPAWASDPALRKHLWALLALLDRGDAVVPADRADGHFLYGANLGFRRGALREVGAFRTDLGPNGARPLRGEDTDMLLRFARAGKRIIYTPHAVVRHKVPRERLRPPYLRQRVFVGGRSVVRMARKRQRLSPWLVRECVTHGVNAVRCYVQRRQEEAVAHDIHCWAQLGMIAEMLGRRPR